MRIPWPRSAGLVRLVAVVAGIACASCGGGGGGRRPVLTAPPPSADVASPLEGEWRLTAFQLADGSSRRVSGFLRYDASATLAMHAELATDEPTARPPRTIVADFTAKASSDGGQFGFAGLSMGVGAERLIADAVAMEEWRHYELQGDTLRVSAFDRAGRPGATLVFERVR